MQNEIFQNFAGMRDAATQNLAISQNRNDEAHGGWSDFLNLGDGGWTDSVWDTFGGSLLKAVNDVYGDAQHLADQARGINTCTDEGESTLATCTKIASSLSVA